MRRRVPAVLAFLMVLLVVGSPVALASTGGLGAPAPADGVQSADVAASDAGVATNETTDGDEKPPGNDTTTDGTTLANTGTPCEFLAPAEYQGSNSPNFCHVLGNQSSEGNLRVMVADGLLATQRYSDGNWVRQFYTYSGAVIVVDGQKTSLGYYNDQPDPTGSFWGSLGDYEAPSSQSISSDGETVTTTWNVDGLEIRQEVTLSSASDQFYRLDWEITNEGGGTVEDVHFLRGEDTYLAGGDFGNGFWTAGTNTVGVTKTVDGVQQRLSFQGITDPIGYRSAFYSTVISDVESGSLENSVNPNNHDNAYALEWQRGAIEPGASWTIRSVESFVRSSLSVSGAGTQTLEGDSETFTFNVSNLGQEARTVSYSVDCPSGISCTTPGSGTIDAGATTEVQVRADVSDDVGPGNYEIVLTASAEGVQSAQGIGQLEVQGPNFQVTGVTAPSSAGVESPITFTAEITNTGAESGTRTVTGSFAGATIDSRTVTLDAGATRTVAFTAAAGAAGTYDATVSTGDDVGSAPVEIVGQEFVCGQSTGDPHITTFGGASYDFMAAGDFVAAREPAGDLLVVARQAPVSDSVSNNNATATMVGDDRVVIDAEAATPVRINGDPVELASGESVAVGDGGEIRKQGRTYTVYYPGDDGEATTSDEHLTVDVIGNRVDIKLCLHPDRAEEVEGLFGDVDGEAGDDIAFANGTALDRPLDPDQLYGQFRDDWRATGEEAIVNGIFYIEDFPRSIVTIDDLSEEERTRAEAVLEDTCLEPGTPQYNDALLDVALSGDESYVASACQVNRDDVQDADDPDGDAGTLPVTSRFGTDTEGWTVVGDAQGGSATPDREATGGNPDGHLVATDNAAGGTWYWNAPDKFLGDKSAAYGGTLSYDLRVSADDSQFDNDDVILRGDGTELVFNLDSESYPSTDWTGYEIPITDDNGWLNADTGEPATRSEIEAVLGSLSALQIRGEYRDGSDTGRLDNVVLSAGNASDGGFQVTNVNAPSSVSTETPFTFSAEITNTGNSQGTATVEGTYATALVDSRTITLDAGESSTVAFRTVSQSVAGTHTATVSTGGDQGTATVEVVGQEFVCGSSTGDPHVTTFGGASYDFMDAGDFVLARSVGGQSPFTIHVRQIPVRDSVSVNNATATTVGGDRVVIDASNDTPLAINGNPTPVEDGGSVAVGDGGEVRRQGNTYTVVYPGDDGQADASDERLTVHVRGNRVDIEVCLYPDRADEVEGLLGDTDGNASDDIAFANGTALARPLDPDTLYGQFSDDWRITEAAIPENGNIFATVYSRENFPQSIVTVEDLSEEERARAEAVLEDTCLEPGTPQYTDALLDVALTGDDSYVASACQVARDDVEDADAGGVSVSLQPADASAAPGGVPLYDVVVEGIDGGVGSYDVRVNSTDTATATITGVSDEIGGTAETELAPDGSTARIAAFVGDTAQTGPVTIATVNVSVASDAALGTTVDLTLTASSVSDEGGTQYAVGSTAGATLTVEETCPEVVAGSPATDPDGDGLCEDVNGDGTATPGDATVLFNAVFDNNPAVTNNVDSFDFNDDGGVTPGDATVLFNEIFSS